MTIAIYAQTWRCGFVAYDDDLYVYRNAEVKEGLTSAAVDWAFTTFHCSNWHPVTWLSHMLDCQLFGLNAGAHHLVNLAFHLANVLVLFFAFVSLTRRAGPSAIVAAVFAVHPLHVQSVAWIAERKDVLSTFLALVALAFYIRYARRPSLVRYAPVALVFALALMAKPMVVTFPFVLLLLDVWPLGRLEWPPRWATLKPLVREKLPLFLLAAAGSASTFIAQETTGAVQSLAGASIPSRLVNACIGYASYLRRAFIPTGLAVHYPIHDPAAWEAAAALVVLVAATLAAVRLGRRHPSCIVGWLWFLGILVPVSGVVQVGTQAAADRYTYLPLVGLTFAIVWPVTERLEGRRLAMRAAAAVAFAAIAALAVAAWFQLPYWRSSEALFRRALAVTQGNYIMHNNLGVILAQEGKYDEAKAHYRQAYDINPQYEDANGNLGHELVRSGDIAGAYPYLETAVRIAPERAQFQADLGTVLVRQGKLDEAREHLEQAVLASPGNAQYRGNLGYVLQRLGRTEEAIVHFAEALRLKPDSPDAHYNMGVALAGQGRKGEAVAELSQALALNPDFAPAREELQRLESSK